MPKSAPAEKPALVWFRDDLRMSDQPALAAAVATGRPVIALFLHDDGLSGGRALGGAQQWWLHHSLAALARSLERVGGRLDIMQGGHETLAGVAQALGAAHVFWTRRYGAGQMAVDAAAKRALSEAGIAAESFNGQLLREPWEIVSKAGQPFKVFSPFWRAHAALGEPAAPLPAPARIMAGAWPKSGPARARLEDLRLLPTRPDWAGGLREAWSPGETGAQARLEAFLERGLRGYADERDRPDLPSTSRLSPHLRFGEISPRRILHATRHLEARQPELSRHTTKFLSEIGWREFSYHLLFHNPDLGKTNFQPRFDAFPWRADEAALEAWRRGRTGYPIVDAGMRELWETGFMHNRVRMVVASFLVKHLLIDWRIGEDWFWDTLCDADIANNAAGWQWVAGSGADAAPYFRVFNPVLQGEKFDPSGAYVRRFVPELKHAEPRWIHNPWTAPASARKHGYPDPVVDHAMARDRALAAFATVSNTAA